MKITITWILLYFLFCHTQSNAQSFLNGSFENWGSPNLCEINVVPDSWSGYSTGCLQFDEANQGLCPCSIPGSASNGNVYARACAGPDWQGGEGVYQMINNLYPGQPYTLSFDYAGSNLYGGSDSVTWRIFVDDTLISQTPYFSSLQPVWTNYSVLLIPTQTIHKIGVRAYFIYPCTSCDGSAGIDNIKLTLQQAEGVPSQNEGVINIYPVPVEDDLIIENINGDVEVTLYDLNARPILRKHFNTTTHLNTSSLVAGTYVCVIRKKGYVIYKKIITKG
ncbi:MAG: T9SS type A sorting domain-containing protein [Chitinophagaceae bacterium]|nr:T9SS type A sorting domain-containing protein [Chitinophagaceae bacterium]